MIPLATTTIDVVRPTEGEPDEPATGSTAVATGVRAHLSNPTGFDRIAGGDERTVERHLDSDPVTGIDATCQVIDNTTGLVYEIVWVEQRQGLGLEHTAGGLRRTQGTS